MCGGRESYHPLREMLCGMEFINRISIEIKHRDILRYARLNRQMHLQINGTDKDILILSVDATQLATWRGLHSRRIKGK